MVASSIESEVDGMIITVKKDYSEEWFTICLENNNLVVKSTMKKEAFLKLKENMQHVWFEESGKISN